MSKEISGQNIGGKNFINLYLMIVAFFLIIMPVAIESSWVSSSDFHSCIEISSSFIALIVAYIAIIFFFGSRERFYLLIGLGFFICGSEDLIHGILSFKRLFTNTDIDLTSFVPATYVAGRISLALIIIVAPLFEKYYPKKHDLNKIAFFYSISALFLGGGLTAFAFSINLPQFIFPENVISRPIDLFSAVLFLVAAVVIFRKMKKQNDVFTSMLFASILLNFGGQMYMSFSKQLFDVYFDIAHWANILSYCMPVLGIALKGLAEMQAVKIEVQEKKIAQEKLKELNKNLEEIIYERTAELQVNNEELKANEDQLYETNLKLNEQTDELMKTINIINNGQVVAFLLQNKEGWPVEYVSANVNEIFGYSKDEFMSGEISYSQIVHEDDLHIVGKEIEENSRKSFINKFAHQPYRIITKNNVTKWIDNRTEIIRNVKNEITHFQGTIIDVTEKIFANKKAKQTELQILAMANNTDSIIYIKDIQGKYILITEVSSIFLPNYR